MSDRQPILYDRIGGEDAVAGLIVDFYNRVLSAPELAPFFENTDKDKLVHMQREFFSAALGGPVGFGGNPLSHAHHGRGITRKHFALFVDHLFESLRGFQLSEREVSETISRINTYVDEVVAGEAGVDG